MARFPHNTAAGAGLGVGGIVPQRSIPINMERALQEETKRTQGLGLGLGLCYMF